jgi:hypothetical protein
MHSKIRPVFSDGKRVDETLAAIVADELHAEDLPKIVVVRVPRNQLVTNPKKGHRKVVKKQFGSRKGLTKRVNDDDTDDGENGAEEENESQGKRNKKGRSFQNGKGVSVADEVDDDDADYFGLNNRRLYVFKALCALGKLDRIVVRMRSVPLSPRLRRRYDPSRCALSANFFLESERESDQNENFEEAVGIDNDDDDDDDDANE